LGAVVVAAGVLLQQNVTVEVDGESRRILTLHREPVFQVRDAGIPLLPGDRVDRAPALVVRRARPIVVIGDGRSVEVRAVVAGAADAAEAAGFQLDPYDRVTPVAPLGATDRFTPPTEATWLAASVGGAPDDARPLEVERFEVRRAVPIVVHDAGMAHMVWTTSATVGEAVVLGGFDLWAADALLPPPGTPVQAGLRIWIVRSRPIAIEVDGRILQTRTRATTVGEVLRQEGIVLEAGDRVEPGLTAPVEGTPIKVVRVRSETLTFREPIAFDVVYRDDPDLPIGQSRVVVEGQPGVRAWSSRVISENGREVQREVVRSWVETPPTPQVVARGTKLVYADIATETGEVATYWAKIRVYVTAYSATSAGKPRGSPGFGITATGTQAKRGVIAVDPTYIPYGTRMYVPGYGIGVAEDTGGGLRGPHIDVCFDDDEPITWRSGYVEIYLLTPAPPVERVRHLLAH
jgi:uncharacterized protein YabE (DUF348 family)